MKEFLMKLNPTTVMTLVTLTLMVAACVVYAIGRRVLQGRARKRSHDTRFRIACDILNAAVQQRSTFRLEVEAGEMKGYKAEGLCVQITDMWLVLDMGGAFASNDWDGEQVLVFFQASEHNKPSHYQFRALIAGVHRKMGSAMLRLPIPKHLEPGQKRSFLRVTPQRGSVLGMGFWPISDTAPLPISADKLPPPLISFRPGKSELIRMDNLSAGGMRLIVDSSIDLLSMVDLDKGSQILCLLVLKGTGNDKGPLALWVASTITAFGHAEGKVNHLSLKFTNWATRDAGQDDIRWFPLSKDKSVALLATWVMRHHLEQSKMS